MTTLISLCMIVKNEEKVLRRCLESVKDLVDEIIIVDTGSTDQTKVIASEFTSFIYDYEWIKDFSAARNESIRKATSKWILVLDADEYVQQEDKQKLKDYLSSLDSKKPVCFLLRVMNILGSSDQNSNGFLESAASRLFPNSKDIYYTQPIHEQVIHKHEKLAFYNYPFIIFHSGYTTETVLEKNKSQRNLEIFETLQQKSNKLTPYYCYSLGNEYAAVRNFKKASYYYEKAYKQAKPNDSWLHHCMNGMINNYFELNQIKKAYDIIQTGLSKWPQFTDFYYYSGLIYDYFGLYDQAKEELLKCIQISDEASKLNRQASLIRLDMAVLLPSKKLAEIYNKELNPRQTVYYLSKLLQSDSSNYSSLLKLIQILSNSEEDPAIISFLEKNYPISTKTNAAFLFRMMLLSGNKGLAEYYYEKCKSLETIFGSTELLHYALITNDRQKFILVAD
ncbi:MAG: hypothetical protein JWM44_4164, partial [Bacilli bacterium]|nr:hypothetical protein [Bacilli bacterium]